MKKIKKVILIIIGCAGLIMGFIGVIVPLLPAFPFLLISAICFSKSSEKINRWFLESKLYKDNLEGFMRGEGMTWKTKIKIMVFVTITMGIGFAMMDKILIGRIVLACIWVFHICLFSFRIKTRKEVKEIK